MLQVFYLGHLVNELNHFEYPEYEVAKTPMTIEDKIVHHLGEEFLAIAKCESGIRQFNNDGSVLISKTSDVGIMQINQVHWERAEELGIDIYTVDGNIEYAKLLKEQNGTDDWFMSEHCWRGHLAYNS